MNSRRAAFLVFAAALLALVATSSSCGLLRSLISPAGPPPRPFNHQAHIERGLDCLSCHETAEKGAAAGMPAKEFCMTCHEEIDKEAGRPREKKVEWFLDESGAPQWARFTKQSSEIRFSHQAHAAKKVACASCHAGLEKDEGLVPGLVQRMDSCTACHAKDDCSTCHSEIAKDRAPSSHGRMWDKLHGVCSRQGRAAATSNDCSMCHQKDECVACHQTQPPKDHTNYWRLRGHGSGASADRVRCQTCHQSDMCDRCHQETSPRTHTAGWNAPKNRHCTSCHVPLQTSGSCFVCHKSTPGHDSAPPKPAWHNAAMNCRSCHAASLPHPDNGDNCNACHK